MIEIEGKIVSLDLFRRRFMCELSACRGMCCVEGNAGAPLEEEEIGILEREYKSYKPYMKPAGVAAVERDGFMVPDGDGDLTTPLIGGLECAYSFERDGITLCAIEKAWKEGKTSFRKPISCHLYPIRVARFSDGTYGLNYHRWNICSPAEKCGAKLEIPVYKALKEPLVRRFGESFYETMVEAGRFLETEYGL